MWTGCTTGLLGHDEPEVNEGSEAGTVARQGKIWGRGPLPGRGESEWWGNTQGKEIIGESIAEDKR